MAIYFIRKDWLLKLSEMCTEVLEVKITTYDKIAQRFFWHNIAAIINMLRVMNSAKNKVT